MRVRSVILGGSDDVTDGVLSESVEKKRLSRIDILESNIPDGVAIGSVLLLCEISEPLSTEHPYKKLNLPLSLTVIC